MMRSLVVPVGLRALHTSTRTTTTLLVTGATGQVGTALTQHLRAIGHRVVATDVRRPTSDNEAVFDRYLDVTDRGDIARAAVESNAQCIVHLAAVLSASGENDPAATLRVNNAGLENVLEVARACKLQVFSPSSIAIFGPRSFVQHASQGNPRDCVPDDAPADPITMYGVTKSYGELLGAYYHAKYGVDFRSLRLPGVVSAARPGGGTTDWGVQMFFAAGSALDRNDDPNDSSSSSFECFARRDTTLPFVYVDDLVEGIAAFLLDTPESSLRRRVYNVGAFSTSPETLAEAIARRVPSFKVEYPPPPNLSHHIDDDPRQAIADSWPRSVDDSAARADWGWNPKFDLERTTDAMLEMVGFVGQPEKATTTTPLRQHTPLLKEKNEASNTTTTSSARTASWRASQEGPQSPPVGGSSFAASSSHTP